MADEVGAHEAGDFSSAVLENALRLWIDPEIGTRGPPWSRGTLHQFQVLFSPGRSPIVRLDDEAKFIARPQLRKGVRKAAGDEILEHELEGLSEIVPRDGEDAGHITAVRFRGEWIIAFDFRYNLPAAQDHVAAAREFADGAESELGSGRFRNFVELAWSAAELAAKAILLTQADEAAIASRSHKVVQARFNSFARLNIAEEDTWAFNRLQVLRPQARYGQTLHLESALGSKLQAAVTRLVSRAAAIVAERGPK